MLLILAGHRNLGVCILFLPGAVDWLKGYLAKRRFQNHQAAALNG
jgi:phosphatidylglycerophosphate synthase